MTSTKSLLLIFTLSALVLMFTSEVSALNDQTMEDAKGSNGVEDAKYGGPGYGGPGGGYGPYPPRGCRYGCCSGYRFGPGCKRCCSNAHEAPDAKFEDDKHE